MRYMLIATDQKYVLADTNRNQAVVSTIREGKFPGLVTIDISRGSVSLNLSETVPFALEGDKFASEPHKPKRGAIL